MKMGFKLGAWETKLKISCLVNLVLSLLLSHSCIIFFQIAVPLLCAAFYSTLQMNEMCLKVENKNLYSKNKWECFAPVGKALTWLFTIILSHIKRHIQPSFQS